MMTQKQSQEATETRPDFPLYWDSTMRSSFIRCPQKFYWEFIRGMRPARPNVHLHFGAAFASGLEAARKHFYYGDENGTQGDQNGAIAAGAAEIVACWGDHPADFGAPGSGANKTLEAALGCLVRYFETWPLTDTAITLLYTHGQGAIEQRFTIPLDVMHPQTGEPLIFCGRYDANLNVHGTHHILDDKSAGSLGQRWAGQWRMRGQFLGYLWAEKMQGRKPIGALVRGICPLKNSIETIETVVMPASWEIDRWAWQFKRDVRRAIACWHENVWDWDLSEACSSYNGCEYQTLCEALRPDDYLSPDFEFNPWNPVADVPRKAV